MTLEGVTSRLIESSDNSEGGYVVTHNLDHLQAIATNPVLQAHSMSADLRVADGVPLLWASRVQGTPLPGRVAGSDLISVLSIEAARRGKSIFLLGGAPGAADGAAAKLCAVAPSLRVAGTYCPPLGFMSNPQELQRMVSAVEAAAPDFVYLGLPFDLASATYLTLRASLPSAWFLGLGVSFSFLAGDRRRAPVWMQSAGLEWVHRLAQEPRRLGYRYLVRCIPFALWLFPRALWQRISPTNPLGQR